MQKETILLTQNTLSQYKQYSLILRRLWKSLNMFEKSLDILPSPYWVYFLNQIIISKPNFNTTVAEMFADIKSIGVESI